MDLALGERKIEFSLCVTTKPSVQRGYFFDLSPGKSELRDVPGPSRSNDYWELRPLRVSGWEDVDPDTKFYSHEVLAALESPRFKWRTIKGISKETGFEPSRIRSALRYLANQGIAIRSSALDPSGAELYTTRKHFKQRASFWELLGAGFRNRAA